MTVSNHVTAVDDPGMVATLIDAKDFASPSHLRWQMCAADRCFRVRALLPMFRGGRVLPVLRGGGTSHHFIDDVVRKLTLTLTRARTHTHTHTLTLTRCASSRPATGCTCSPQASATPTAARSARSSQE